MSQTQPFCPSYGSGQNLTATSSSQQVSIRKGTKAIRIVNSGANSGQIKIGNGDIEATTADLHVPPGVIEVFTKDETHDKLAYISASGTTFNIMVGEGW